MEPQDDPTDLPPATDSVFPAYSPAGSWRDSPRACALVAILGTGLLGAGLMALSIERYGDYGITLFCLSPGICAFAAVLLHEWMRPGNQGSVWRVTRAVVGIMAAIASLGYLVLTRLEGIICLLMALPIMVPIALVGAFVGALLGDFVVQLTGRPRPLPLLCAVLVLYPTAQEAEVRLTPPPAPRLVTTQVVVNAPPARVWAALLQPMRFPAATGWFRAGVVYPVSTAFATDAAGQHQLVCQYSQGLARLPVVGWQPGRQLTFAVPPATMPAPMHEISPYPQQLHAPHLHGYFQVDSGTFRLRALPGGRTLLEARTVYRHAIAPRAYWQLWSDHLLDATHRRVLATLKTQAEAAHDQPAAE